MPRKPGHISIIQFDAQRISRLQCQRGTKGIELLQLDHVNGSWAAQDGSLAAALSDFVRDFQVGDDEVYGVLPRHDVTVRILTLPTHSLEEAARMIQLSIDEYVPYSPEELIVDQCMLEQMESGESRVLAVFAHRDAVLGHVALLKQAGLEPQRIFLSTACLASAAVAGGKDAGVRFAIVDLASGGLEVAVIDRGHLHYSRGIATVQDWQQAGEDSSDARQELAIELRGSLAAYRRESEDGAGVDSVYLCSSWAAVDGVARAMQEELGKDVYAAEFAKGLVSGGAASDTSPLVLLGAVLTVQNRSSVSIDLLPADVRRGREFQSAKKQALRYVLLGVLVFAVFGLLFLQSAWQRAAYVSELEAQLGAIKPSAEKVVSMQRDLRILDEQVSNQENVLSMISAVVSAAPEGELNITKIEFDREAGINLFGRAKSVTGVHGFIDGIRALAAGQLEFFQNAHSIYERPTPERDQTVYQFNISIPTTEKPDAEEQ